MSSSHRLTREQKGKGAVSSRDSGDIHHEAMMDTGNMDLSQRLLVSEAREQFRGDDDGQEAVDASIVPISYYPGNIFAEESPLEHWISDSLPHINRSTSKRLSLFTQAEQKEINRARTMKKLPDLSLIVAGKIGTKKGTSGSKVAPSKPRVAATTPVASEQALAGVSSQQKNFQKKKKEVDARRESNEERDTERAGAEGSSKKGSKKRKAGDLSSGDMPKKKKTKKKDSAVPRPSSVCEEELQELVPEVAPEVGTSDDEDETIALPAAALRTPFVDRASRSEDLMREPSATAVSATRNADEDVNLAERKSADAAVPKDGNVPTIVLTDSPAKASKNVSSSTSSSEDPVRKDDAPADRSIEATTANVDLSAQTKFGRVSGPGEEDGDGGKNPPAGDE
uniref:Uncharacterized protein n=1 Tax=Brassica campestris TaxID=3711 RepID=M4F3T6_BRACM